MVLIVADVFRYLDTFILKSDDLYAIVFNLLGKAFREELVFCPIAIPAMDHISGFQLESLLLKIAVNDQFFTFLFFNFLYFA